jgi:hypothetical protein
MVYDDRFVVLPRIVKHNACEHHNFGLTEFPREGDNILFLYNAYKHKTFTL